MLSCVQHQKKSTKFCCVADGWLCPASAMPVHPYTPKHNPDPNPNPNLTLTRGLPNPTDVFFYVLGSGLLSSRGPRRRPPTPGASNAIARAAEPWHSLSGHRTKHNPHTRTRMHTRTHTCIHTHTHTHTHTHIPTLR